MLNEIIKAHKGKIFVTSDTHFCHDKDFLYGPRGFTNVEDMNEEIIKNWNEVVGPDDIVIHLGDAMMGQDTAMGLHLLSRLNGRKFLIIGNHDTDAKIELYKDREIFEGIFFGERFKKGKIHFVLSHYPTIVENYDSPIRTVNLFGHIHLPVLFYNDRWDMFHCGLEGNNNTPWLLEDIIEQVKNKRRETLEARRNDISND